MTELESKTLCVDIDHTICVTPEGNDYGCATPMPGALDALRELRRCGWTIVLHTARHFNHWKTTSEWLEKNEVPYDQIVFGKPPARYYIDDRAIPFQGNWEAVIKQCLESR